MSWLSPKPKRVHAEPTLAEPATVIVDRPVSIQRFRFDKPHFYRGGRLMPGWRINAGPPAFSAQSLLWRQAHEWLLMMERAGRMK